MNDATRPAPLRLLRRLATWLLLACCVAAVTGAAAALFLSALDWAGATRIAHRELIWLLPIAGFAVGWVYLRIGQRAERGTALVIAAIDAPQTALPLRMAPLVFGATVISHLFGASVGREGTAVQMGGVLADRVARAFRLAEADRPLVLMAGIGAGFAAVFGTPLAGAVFALEIAARRRHAPSPFSARLRARLHALTLCLVAAVAADRVGQMLGVRHAHYAIASLPQPSLRTWAAIALAGALFGFAAFAFVRATRAIGGAMQRHVRYAPLRPFIGGAVIAAAVFAFGADRYVGLGLPTIAAAFAQPLPFYDFLAKMASTAVSLGSGFKGGEVTPLFYIGATLGNALAPLLQLPVALLAGLGLAAVFAGATSTPLASTLMAIELFGADVGLYAALACTVSHLASGRTGIYKPQTEAANTPPLNEHAP